MASTTAKATAQKATAPKPDDKVKVFFPKLRGRNEDQTIKVSINGKNYVIERGEEVEIPYKVKQIIDHSEQAEEDQFKFIEQHAKN